MGLPLQVIKIAAAFVLCVGGGNFYDQEEGIPCIKIGIMAATARPSVVPS